MITQYQRKFVTKVESEEKYLNINTRTDWHKRWWKKNVECIIKHRGHMILYKMMRQYKKWVFVWPVNFFFMLLCKWLCRYSPVFLKKWCHIQKSTKGRHCFNGKCLTKGSNPDFTNLSIFRQNLKVHHMFIIADCYKKPTWRKLSRVNQIWTHMTGIYDQRTYIPVCIYFKERWFCLSYIYGHCFKSHLMTSHCKAFHFTWGTAKLLN